MKFLQISSTEQKITIKQFLNRLTYVDPRFQRRACWKAAQKELFFRSLVKGYAVNPIINAVARSCESYCKKQGFYREMGDFQHVIAAYGAQFISVDGQNRAAAILGYWNNEFTSSAFSVDGKRKLYKNLSKEEQEAFLNLEILVVDITKATYSQLTEVFVAVNGGMPLNRMELRNALNSAVAQFVRDLREAFPFILDRVESVTSSRMKDLDTALKAACFVHSELICEVYAGNCDVPVLKAQKDLPFSDNALDKFYEYGIGQGLTNIDYYGAGFKGAVYDMFNWLSEVLSHAGNNAENGKPNKVTMPFFWSLCSVYRLMEVENKLPELSQFASSSVNFHAAVFDIVATAHEDLTRQSHLDYGNDLKKNPKQSKGKYYCYYSTDVKDPEKRLKVGQQLLSKIPKTVADANHWRNSAHVV